MGKMSECSTGRDFGTSEKARKGGPQIRKKKTPSLPSTLKTKRTLHLLPTIKGGDKKNGGSSKKGVCPSNVPFERKRESLRQGEDFLICLTILEYQNGRESISTLK